MRRGMTVLLAVVVAFGLGLAAVSAGGPGCGGHKEGKAVGDAGKSGCKLGAFPSMTMKVGDKTYQCPMEAGKAAKAGEAPVVYLVADRTYNDKNEAMEALAKASECYLERFVKIGYVQEDGTVAYRWDDKNELCLAKKASGMEKEGKAGSCSHGKGAEGRHTAAQDGEDRPAAAKGERAGCSSHAKKEGKIAEANFDPSKCKKFVVVGREFDNYEAAVKARDEAMTAIHKVKLTYVVDGKEVDGTAEICRKAKADGKVEYRVCGEKTNCESAARASLAKAQYEAAKTVADKLARA